jgi:hypothetical protein
MEEGNMVLFAITAIIAIFIVMFVIVRWGGGFFALTC